MFAHREKLLVGLLFATLAASCNQDGKLIGFSFDDNHEATPSVETTDQSKISEGTTFESNETAGSEIVSGTDSAFALSGESRSGGGDDESGGGADGGSSEGGSSSGGSSGSGSSSGDASGGDNSDGPPGDGGDGGGDDAGGSGGGGWD